MKYSITKGKIVITNNSDFDIQQILECGQVFRYRRVDNGWEVCSLSHKATICCQKGTTNIFCDNEKYFEKYFDLSTDYATIKTELRGNKFVEKALELGSGIRILRQDPFETIISFIISANNNIPRIKKIIESICEKYGSKKSDYYAFPTLKQLKDAPKEFFQKIGCGYRSQYLVDTINALSNGFSLKGIEKMLTAMARRELIKLRGVGGKVADCILLFGYHKMDTFPCDVWIKKVFAQNFGGNIKTSAGKISEYFVSLYGDNAGFAQQYLYYYKRSKEKKENE